VTGLKKYGGCSVVLCNLSILLYVFWLLLPMVQTTGRALCGAAAVGLFALGAALDGTLWKRPGALLATLARAVCAALLPVILFVFAGRGGGVLPTFFVQHCMFWFPLVFAGYARLRGDSRLWRGLKTLLVAVTVVTLLTSIFWLVEGMFFRGDRVYAYARSLGNATPGNEAYLKELMLKNIGGYDFVYAMVAALPLSLLGMQRSRGRARLGYTALACAQVIMILLSQYTYAMIYAAVLLAVEAVAAVVRRISGGRVGMGASLLLGLVPLVLVWLFRMPLLGLLTGLLRESGLNNVAFSLEQLTIALQGGATDGNSRLSHYLVAWQGFTASPLIGSVALGQPLFSQHSDVLDLLSGAGLVGAAAVGVLIWLMGRGTLRGIRQSESKAQLCVMWLCVLVTALFGTVCYSRDIMAVAALGSLLVLEGEKPAATGAACTLPVKEEQKHG